MTALMRLATLMSIPLLLTGCELRKIPDISESGRIELVEVKFWRSGLPVVSIIKIDEKEYVFSNKGGIYPLQ